MADASNLKSQIEALRYNPAGIQRTILDMLDEANDGNYNVVDPSNPFVFLLEASTINASAAMSQSAALTRKQYPSMALTAEELYLHMSDKDYINRFASPSRGTFTIILGKDELYQRAVETSTPGVRQLTIPRNTEFHISDYVFSMQYPIDIRIMNHGGMQVVYNVSRTSPLQTLASNLVDWKIVNIEGVDYLWMDVPVYQFQINTQYAQLNTATGYSKTFTFTDQFYYCRVYASTTTGSWEEIKTTHTDQVFDPMEPTVSLTLLDDKLKVTVPHVYITTGLMERELRIDIHTTKGPLELILSNYEINSFTATWLDLDNEDKGLYSAPLGLFSSIAVFSEFAVTGGSNIMSFEDLRERVINNALGQYNLPITNIQLSSTLDTMGYALVNDVDNVTNRIFLASRTLPPPTDGTTVSGANTQVTKLQTSMEDLSIYETIMDNGQRTTICPSTLYRMSSGVLELVSDQERKNLLAQDVDEISDRVTADTFLYTPFHYVLDATEDTFEARAYYLDNPGVDTRQFVEENPSAGMSVATNNITLTRSGDGYLLRFSVRSGDLFKALSDDQIVVQLAFRPENENLLAYMNATQVGFTAGGERIFEFHMTTDYDVDNGDNLNLTSFIMFDSEQGTFASPLLGDFDLLYYVLDTRPNLYDETNMDTLINKDLLPSRDEVFMGLTHEHLTLRLGWSLDSMWSNARTVASSVDYKRYTADVPAVYEQNVYERDPVTGAIVLTKNANGSVNYNLLHKKGDPVLDSKNKPVMKYKAGDVMVVNGQPVTTGTRSLLRQVELVLLDGRYYFATDSRSVTYRKDVATQMVSWVTEDIEDISQRLLEQTRLFFYPQATMGDIEVMVGEGKMVTMESSQRLTVTYYLTRTGYRNGELRAALTDMTVENVALVLNKTTITTNDLTSRLTALAGDDVVGIDVEGLGGDDNYVAVTLTDDSIRCSIAKKLVNLADGTLAVEDDVNIIFIQHEIA